jgi:hypothetical protein
VDKMNPFQLAGKFLNPTAKEAVSLGIVSSAKDPLNQSAGYLFGLPYVTLPALGIMSLNGGSTAPGTLDEARRLGLLK